MALFQVTLSGPNYLKPSHFCTLCIAFLIFVNSEERRFKFDKQVY